MNTSDVIAIIQTLVAIGAFIFAYAEFKKWRVELLGNKKIDLALRLGIAAIEVREAFKYARMFFRRGGEGKAPEYKAGSTPEEIEKQNKEIEKQNLEHDFNQRLQHIQSKLSLLYNIRWEAVMLLSDNENIEEQIAIYNAKFHELQRAMLRVYKSEQTEEEFTIVFSSGDDDFGRTIEDNTNKLLKLAQKYTR